MRTEKIVDGIKVILVTPDLTEEERMERAAWIMDGLEKIYASHMAKKARRLAEEEQNKANANT